jgi:hypothetical protein
MVSSAIAPPELWILSHAKSWTDVRERICTSHIERKNLSVRMGMRRMTRLTKAFSKKWDNLQAAYSLWFAFYNFCRAHKTLRITPAMEACITDHVLTTMELIS